jgi:hypothetical protein
MIDTIVRGWSCMPLFIIQRPECVEICSGGEDHVFDGAHKAEAGCEFIDGSFPITYRKSEAQFGALKEYAGKYFKDLPPDLRLKIKNYSFSVNIIDEETANDPDALSILWKRISRAGKPLNSYEISIPVLAPLIHAVLTPAGEQFKGSILFPDATSNRGTLERFLQLLLAIAELPSAQHRLSSINDVIYEWQIRRLGVTMTQRTESVAQNTELWIGILNRIFKILGDLIDLNMIGDAEGNITIVRPLLKTELPFVLARLAARFPRIEDFRSQKIMLADRFKREIFNLSLADLQTKFDGNGRNGAYQTKLLRHIETIIDSGSTAVQPRIFTTKQKKEKLEQQGGECTWCHSPILPKQKREGDHIVEWSQGGATTLDNLEVLHLHCHQQKTAGNARPISHV